MRVMLGFSLLPGSFSMGWRHQEKGRGPGELATFLMCPVGFRAKLLVSSEGDIFVTIAMWNQQESRLWRYSVKVLAIAGRN